jgi:hypothetical protein
MNKVDPRVRPYHIQTRQHAQTVLTRLMQVDSDKDHSMTMGADKTNA